MSEKQWKQTSEAIQIDGDEEEGFTAVKAQKRK